MFFNVSLFPFEGQRPTCESPFLELCEFQELNAGFQAWQQAPIPARASGCPACVALNTH